MPLFLGISQIVIKIVYIILCKNDFDLLKMSQELIYEMILKYLFFILTLNTLFSMYCDKLLNL